MFFTDSTINYYATYVFLNTNNTNIFHKYQNKLFVFFSVDICVICVYLNTNICVFSVDICAICVYLNTNNTNVSANITINYL